MKSERIFNMARCKNIFAQVSTRTDSLVGSKELQKCVDPRRVADEMRLLIRFMTRVNSIKISGRRVLCKEHHVNYKMFLTFYTDTPELTTRDNLPSAHVSFLSGQERGWPAHIYEFNT